jgi:hypothetical protein
MKEEQLNKRLSELESQLNKTKKDLEAEKTEKMVQSRLLEEEKKRVFLYHLKSDYCSNRK